jgi:energy-coupling factor transporter ATP-binding protein EcfA2
MKLDITSLYFNGDTKSAGNTASWGTALGQEKPNYPISAEGGQDIVDLIKINHFDFNPSKNSNHTANIKSLDDKIIFDSGKFDSVYVNNIEFNGPFYLLVIEEASGSHIGRKNLKYNNKIKVHENSNEDFYNRIKKYFGKESCWFIHDISSINGQLHMSAVKVDNKPVSYENAMKRKEHWESLINDFSDNIEKFKTYCVAIRGIKNKSTIKEYIKTMPEVKAWFLENNICNKDFQIWSVYNDLSNIKSKLKNEFKEAWQSAAKKNAEGDYGFKMAAWNRWTEFVDWYFENSASSNSNNSFNSNDFQITCKNSGLVYSMELTTRFVASLATKPFVLLSGLSGSGKTKLAQSFAQWICEDEKQYCIVPVGADWTNREPLLGYVNALNPEEYILPENGALQLIIEANKDDNKNKPYFLILDEMNLSHVERYFADFLSVMESKDKFKLHSDKEQEKSGVPFELSWPKNLFVVGTVNIDETTYMFSPKVLDRANAIEFRVTEKEISKFLKSPNQIDLTQLESKGANMAADFIKIVRNNEFEKINTDNLNETLVNFFGQLQKTGAEFGYRTGMEIHRLYQQLIVINKEISENEKIDITVMQKLLPKLHGSRRKLCPILETLGNICVKDLDVKKDIFENEDFKLYKEIDGKLVLTEGVLYPLSLEKITRMYKSAIDNGFASYAEA